MLTLLILMLVSKFRSRAKAKRKLATLAILALLWMPAMTQKRLLNYEVTSDGKVIGAIVVTEIKKGDSTHVTVTANMRPRLIISIPVLIREEAWMEKGIMVRSQYQRKVNGAVKLVRHTHLGENMYISVVGKETIQIKQYPLKNNMLNMFIREPVGHTHVYSNSMAVLLPVRKVKDTVYEILYPDGKKNQYHYKDNTCTRIYMHQKMFSAEVILKTTESL